MTKRSGVFVLSTGLGPQRFMLHLKEEVQDTIVLSCLVGNPRAALRRVEGLLTKVTQSAADVVVVTQFVFWMSTRQLLSALPCCL